MLKIHHPAIRQIVKKYCTGTSTVNEEEVKKFAKLSSLWWDSNGPFKGLHSLNLLRVPFVKNGIITYQGSAISNEATVISPLSGCNILDVGCGGGLLSESLARLGAKVTAIDPCEENIAVASLHAQKSKLLHLNYEVKTIEQLAQTSPKSLFDAITASEVIEHVESPEFFIQMCSNLLKPGGSLFITTINRTTASWALAIVAAEYVLNVVPKGTHDWNKFVTPDELKSYLSKNDCKLRQIYGMAYNPFANSWKWSGITSINYALHATKPQQESTSETNADPIHSPKSDA